MEKLLIKKIDGNIYFLKSEEKNYSCYVELHDLEELPQVGDCVHMDEKFFIKDYSEYSDHYIFGSLNNIAGRKITEENESEVIVLETKSKKTYLKRLYG